MIVDLPLPLLVDLLMGRIVGFEMMERVRGATMPKRKPLAPAMEAQQETRASARRKRS
jgi:hypothetical protein